MWLLCIYFECWLILAPNTRLGEFQRLFRTVPRMLPDGAKQLLPQVKILVLFWVAIRRSRPKSGPTRGWLTRDQPHQKLSGNLARAQLQDGMTQLAQTRLGEWKIRRCRHTGNSIVCLRRRRDSQVVLNEATRPWISVLGRIKWSPRSSRLRFPLSCQFSQAPLLTRAL